MIELYIDLITFIITVVSIFISGYALYNTPSYIDSEFQFEVISYLMFIVFASILQIIKKRYELLCCIYTYYIAMDIYLIFFHINLSSKYIDGSYIKIRPDTPSLVLIVVNIICLYVYCVMWGIIYCIPPRNYSNNDEIETTDVIELDV